MAIKILKTSAKHYYEKKKLAFAPLAPIRNPLKIQNDKPGSLLDLFGQDVKCKNNFWWRINRFKNISELPKPYLHFIDRHITNDWGLNLNIEHDFNVMKRIFINSILNN